MTPELTEETTQPISTSVASEPILETPSQEPEIVEEVKGSKVLEMNDDFKSALNLMENSTHSIFITGKAGSGKSTLLRHFRETTKKRVVVLAPTGIAAINITGQTIHSFFKFPIKIMFPDVVARLRGDPMLKGLQTIIIDEVSMVRADILDAIDGILRQFGPLPGKPFGGVQMIFFGDLYQLPPVVSTEEKEAYKTLYNSPFFFKAHVFEKCKLKKIELRKIYRQKDPEFIRLLENIRNNTVNDEDLKKINELYDPFFMTHNDVKYVTLTTTNSIAQEINKDKLSRIMERETTYTASVEGDFRKDLFPTDEKLILKKGAQVIFLRNDPERRWVNGSLGTVVVAAPGNLQVEIDNGFEKTLYNLDTVKWENTKYGLDSNTKKITPRCIGKFTQYPLKLAYAITIHKSQGATFDNVAIHFGWGSFAHGQTYVAFSRCRTMEGIKLLTKLSRDGIILDPDVMGFMDFVGDKPDILN